jgi:hypothetical protein
MFGRSQACVENASLAAVVLLQSLEVTFAFVMVVEDFGSAIDRVHDL